MVNNYMSELFTFTCYINPPTKNEVKFLRSGKKFYPNPKFHKPWDEIQRQMGIVKPRQMSKDNIILSVWNGFKKIDIANFLSELEDRLQGIVYYNDRQIKEEHLYKLDDEEKQFFKVIVETME